MRAAPISQAVVTKNAAEPESATGMLQLAQKLHDDYVRSGQEEGDRLIAEAKEEGSRIVREAEETSHRTLSQLEQERSLLERKIDELRIFERDYRTRLKSYLQNLLGDLDNRGSALPPRSNVGGRAARATSLPASSTCVDSPAAAGTPRTCASLPPRRTGVVCCACRPLRLLA